MHGIVFPASDDSQNSKLAVFKSQRRNETRSTVFDLVEPLGDLELVIDNAEYERYDAEDVFVGEFISKSKKVLRQWKQKLTVKGGVFPALMQEFSVTLAELLKEEIRNTKLSLLGALYLEKAVRKIKSFI